MDRNRIIFVVVSTLIYFFVFGITLEYGVEISGLDISSTAFYITQINYTLCFFPVLLLCVSTNQSLSARVLIVGVLVNVATALTYAAAHLVGGGDWSSLWRLVGTYSRFYGLFIIANLISHLASEFIAVNLERFIPAATFSFSPARAPADKVNHLSSEMDYAHRILEQRASELRRSAAVAIFGIVAVLFASALLFIFAGQIATLGNLRVDAYEEARTLQERYGRRLEITAAELLGQLKSLKAQQPAPTAAPSQTTSPHEPTAFSQTLDKIETASEAVKQASEQVSKIGDELRTMREKLIQAQIEGKKNIDVEFMIFSSVTRFGVLGISAYLVYILVNLYRFNVLQSVFYNSLSDAILINGRIDLSNVDAIKSFRSDITFGNMHERTMTSMLSEIKNLLESKDSPTEKKA